MDYHRPLNFSRRLSSHCFIVGRGRRGPAAPLSGRNIQAVLVVRHGSLHIFSTSAASPGVKIKRKGEKEEMLSAQDVATHATRQSCWIIVSGQVYDVTEFLDQHPGGPSVILRYAGRDATKEYQSIHPPDALQVHLPVERWLGPVDPATTAALKKGLTQSTASVPTKPDELPPLSSIISLQDFEVG